MKKFMIFLLMAFLYIGTSQASNEITSLSNDAVKSLHHWVAPSMSSPTLAAMPMAPIDSTINVAIVGPTNACAGEVVVLTAVVVNNYLGMDTFQWRIDGDFVEGGGLGLGNNQVRLTVPASSGGLDDLLHEIDVRVVKGCQSINAVHYLRVNSTHISLESVSVCPSESVGQLVAHVTNNETEMPYAYVWYKDGVIPVDTTYVPFATLPVDTYVVEGHFTHSACITRSNEAVISNATLLNPNHLTLTSSADNIICDGGQVTVVLNGLKDNYGTASIMWDVNGFEFPSVHDTTFTFSPSSIQGNHAKYYIHAAVQYSGYPCATFTLADTVSVNRDPQVSIVGNPIVCHDQHVVLNAVVHDTITTPSSYLWRVDGVDSVAGPTFDRLLTARTYPYEITVVINAGTPCEAVSDVYSVYVGSFANVYVTVAPDPACVGQRVVAVAHIGDNNLEGLTYSWKVNNVPVLHATESVMSYTIDDPEKTIFEVLVHQNGTMCSVTGKDSVITNVNPRLDSISVVSVQDDVTRILPNGSTRVDVPLYGQPAYDVCEGAGIRVTAYMINASGVHYTDSTVSYLWRRNGVIMPGVTEYTFVDQVTTEDHDSFKYVYTAEIAVPSVPNCYSIPSSVTSDTVRVSRNPRVIIAGQHYFCEPADEFAQNITLHAWVDGNSDADASFTWYKDGMYDINPLNIEHGYIYTGKAEKRYGFPYTYTVEVTNGMGCTAISDPFEVVVMAKPEIVITPYSDVVCNGGEVTLTANFANEYVDEFQPVFQWYKNRVGDSYEIPGATHAIYNGVADQTTNYIARVEYMVENTNWFTCQAYDTITVTVYDTPVITGIEMSLTEICEGSQVVVSAVLDQTHRGVPGVPYIYNWYRNGELLTATDSILYDSPMTVDGNEQQFSYSVSVYQYPEVMLCESSRFYSTETLTVYPNPIVVVTGDQHVCKTNAIELTASVDMISNPVGGLHYYWYESGAPITNLYGDSAVLSYKVDPKDEPYRFVVQVERDGSNTGCRSYSYEYQVYVYDYPAVSLTASNYNVCEGAQVTLTSHLQDINLENIAYSWYAGDTITDTYQIYGASEPEIVVNVNDTTCYMVVATNTLSNCSYHSYVYVNTYEVPVITSIVMSDSDICEGADLSITAYVEKGMPDQTYYFEWRRNGELLPGNTSTIYDNPMTADGTTQTFTYTAIAYQVPGELACVSEIDSSAPLTVYANPRVEISGDQHICNGSNIVISANVDNFTEPVGELNYYWYESGRLIASTQNNILTLPGRAKDEPYRFTVQVERGDATTGCRSYSNEYDVYVYFAPVANVTIVDQDVCKGAEVTLTAHLNNLEQTNLLHQWFNRLPGETEWNLIPGATELTYTTILNTTTEFRYQVVHSLSLCRDQDFATIYVHEIPVVNSVSMSDTNICEGADVTITANIENHMGVEGMPYYYEWRRNGELLAANTQTIHDTPMTTDGTNQTFVYSVIAYQTPERLACYSELVNSATLTVVANPQVVITGDPHVCIDDRIRLLANVDTFSNIVSNTLHYTWYQDGEIIRNENGDSRDLSFRHDGTREDGASSTYHFTVQIERDNNETGCRSYSQVYNVTVYEKPDVNITAVDTKICKDGEVNLTAHLNLNTPEQSDLQYQWYKRTTGGAIWTAIPGATELNYISTIDKTTEFRFVVEHMLSGCTDSDSILITKFDDPVVSTVSMSDTNICEGAQVTIHAATTGGVDGLPYFFEWRRNGELIEGNTATIYDSPVVVDGNEQTFYYSVIAYQNPERLGCASALVSSATLNVYPNPVVAISGDQHVCETDSIFLVANVDTIGRPVGLLHYTWYESGRLRDNMAYGLGDSRYYGEYYYPQTEPYRFTVEVHRDNIAAGCRSYSEEFLVWVYEEPVVNITASETTICTDGQVTLTANLDNYAFDYANNSEYQWYEVTTDSVRIHIGYNPDGSYRDTIVAVENVTPILGATTLTYTTSLTTTSRFGFTAVHTASGCNDYDEIEIQVNPIPVVDSIQLLSEQDTICPGGRVELKAHVSGGVESDMVYTWYRNGEVVESNGDVLIDYPISENGTITHYTYQVIVKQAASGCQSVFTEQSQFEIWVSPSATIQISGDPIVCDTTNPNIVLTANIVAAVDPQSIGGLTYQWFENNAPLAGETSTTLSTQRPYRDYPYSFNFAVYNQFGCNIESEPFLVYVNTNPVVNITADDESICVGGTVTLTATLYDQNASNLTYKWYKKVGSGDFEEIVGANNPTYTTTLTETTTFRFNAYQTDSHCAANSNELTINVNAIPEISSITVVSEDRAICDGHPVILRANVDGGQTGDAVVFTWYKNSEVIPGAILETLTDYPVAVDNDVTPYGYKVTVAQASSGCESVLNENNHVIITVRPNPVFTIYGDQDVCVTNNVELHAHTQDPAVGPMDAYTITWYVDGHSVEGQTTPMFEGSYPAREYAYNFKFAITDVYGCSAETEDYPVMVYHKPHARLTASESDICTNGTVTLTAHLFDQNEENITYMWQKAVNGTFEMIEGANEATYTTTLAATTEFRVLVFQTNSECLGISDTMKINVVNAPVVTSITVLSEDTAICEGHEVTLRANISGGVTDDEVTYTWYKNGVVIEGANEAIITDYPTALDNSGMGSPQSNTHYIYNVTVAQTSSACYSLYDNNDIVPIHVRPIPYIYVNGIENVCENADDNNVVLQAQVYGYVGSLSDYTFWWIEDDTIIAGQNSTTLDINRPYRDQVYNFKFGVYDPQYGCTAKTNDYFYVNVHHVPGVTATVDQDTICSNGFATLTATLINQNEENLIYQWHKNDNGEWHAIAGANNLTYTTDNLTQTTLYKLAVVNLESGCQKFSNEVAVNVHATPTINIEYQSATHICDGGTIALNATQRSEYAGLGDVTYQWYVNGVSIEGANSRYYVTEPLAIDGDHTIYNIAVRATMSHSACQTAVAGTVVNVYSNPTVEITYNNGLVLCEGGSTTLTANAHHMHFYDPDHDNFSYQWFMNGLPIPGANSKTYTVRNLNASADSYIFSVVVSVNPGQQTGCNVVSSDVAVTIVPDPIANITVAENVSSICEGGVVTFNVNVEGGVSDAYNAYTYAWYNNFNPNTVLGTEASYTTSVYDEAALYTYWVDVTSAYGCNVRATYQGFEIVETPTVAIAVVPGADAAVCNGGHTQLMANVEGGLGQISYQWYKNGVALTGETNQTLTTEPLFVNQTAAYTVAIAQSGIACTATSTQFNVPVYDNIDVTINTNSYINCVGGSVILTAEAANAIPNDVLNYQWYRTYNGISTAINGATNYVYNTAANLVPGTYEYSVQVSSNISGCQVALSSSLAITVEDEPTVTIYSDDADNVICQGGDLTLYANVTYPTNSTNHNNQYRYTWKWYQNGTLMTAQTTSPQYTISNTLPVGTYNFFVDINSNDGLGCDATSQATPFAVTVNPIPVVSIVPSAIQSCEGGSISVTAQVIPTNLTGAYAWTVNGEAVPSIQNTVVLTDLPLGTNTISVVFIPDNACQSDVATITHEVITTPVVTVTPDDINHTVMCAGGRIALTASATGDANYQYEWMVDGQTLPGFHGSNLSRELSAAGTYSFQARVISTLGCNSAYSVPVVVSVAEQPEVAISQISGYSDMCVGGEITLMANVTNYGIVNEGVTNNTVHGTYNYVWKRDGNDFAASTDVVADRVQIDETLGTPSSFLYSVTVTATGYNCQPATAVLDHLINVVPDPTWTVNQVSPSELCLGGVVFLSAEVTGGIQTQQAGQIQWYKTFNGIETAVAGLGGVNTDIPEYAGVYSYMPKYIDYNGVGCNIEAAAASQVIVNELPTAEFTMGSGEVLCASSTLDYATLEITLTGTAPYTFTILNVTTGESQTIVTSLSTYSYNVHPSTTTVYRLVSVVDANGCEGLVNGVADAVIYISNVSLVSDHVTVDCETFIAQVYVNVNASLSTTYNMIYPNGVIDEGTLEYDNNAHLYYALVQMDPETYSAGDYELIISIEGCEAAFTVTVPANNLTMGLANDFVDQRWDDVVVVNNNPDNNGGYKFFTYQWYRNGQAIPGATGQYYQEEGGLNGFYSVEVNGVRKSDNAPVHFVTCEIYFSSASQIRVYPVPATSTQEVFIELNMTNEELEGAILDIYDVKGAHIKSMTNLTPITKVSSFGAQGTYFGRIITGTNEIKTVKFIIVK